ncbi:MAG: hypothetical protein MI892_11315 [Desulfobacterales bacterium]|nr:hypothetical protein [Desulfobacterales bacterium]
MSVGHIARGFEAEGLPTVVIAVKAFETKLKNMGLPRVLLTPEVMGRPMGDPFDKDTHINYLTSALKLLESASANGIIKICEDQLR